MLFISNTLLAEVKESISEKEIFVGDLIQYNIEYKDISNLTIHEGDNFSDEEIPDFRISDVTKGLTNASCKIIFFKVGKFYLPIEWEEFGEKQNSKILIEVKPRLAETESDISDIEPPLFFAGSIGLKLFIIILLVLLNLYIIYALILYFKKRKKIYNATWTDVPILSGQEKINLQLEQLFSTEKIKEKYFYYVITEILKESFSKKLQLNLKHLTDTEFFFEIKQRTTVNQEEVDKMSIYFSRAKYRENENEISSEEGYKVWKSLQTQLKL